MSRFKVPLLFGVWSVPVLLASAEMTRNAYEHGGSVILWKVVLYQALSWYPWVLFSPVVARLARRFPFRRGVVLRSLVAHLSIGLAVSATLTILIVVFEAISISGNIRGLAGAGPMVARLLPVGLTLFSGVYWIVLGVSLAIDHYQRLRRGELHASQLETLLAQAQLQALRAQLHPHFLFNTLHAISSLMDEDVVAARRMIARLSDLLRASLQNAGGQQVTLEEELKLLELYLDIERIRFQDRLTVEMSIDPETLQSRVPSLLLQPLVENAIRHGIAASSKAGCLEIGAHREGARLRLEIRDDGPGLVKPHPAEGVGLKVTRERLRNLYDSAFSLELRNGDPAGCEVRLELPFVTEAARATA